MSDELTASLIKIAAAASRLDRICTEPAESNKGLSEYERATNKLQHAVRELSPEARKLLEMMYP